VLPGDRNLDLELAERIARHLPVIVWTVNEVDRLPALRDAGVFGVITDEPAVSVAWGAK
jgi:glycerophosphoryl diester phosphodiesterase